MPTAPPQLPIWSAPLVPVALALTVGIVADRQGVIPISASLGASAVCVLGWLVFLRAPRKLLPLVYLWISLAGLGAAYHHWHRHHFDASDLSRVTHEQPQPARLRGVVHSAPITQAASRDPLRTLPATDTTRFVLRATHWQTSSTHDWHEVSGLVQVAGVVSMDDITIGDEIEILGRLALPGAAMNPGEFDYADFLRDQGITTTLNQARGVTRTRRGWPMSLFGWLAVVRGWGQETLKRDFSAQHEVAAALLLGEGSGMSGEAWEQYMRTGVIHVLAISGQHLFVLAGFLWLSARLFNIRRRSAAFWIALFLVGYALLTGGRPPVMRAAWMVAIFAGGMIVQRPTSMANTFALAWIGVLLINPTDLFNAGCQLSFLAVAVLVWGVGQWAENQPSDPLELAIDQARSWPATIGIQSLRTLRASYAINAAVWLTVAPLIAAHYHTVSPIVLLIGPPMVVLTSVALLTGFAFLLFAGWCFPLAWIFSWLTQGSLYCCELIVSQAQHLPGAYFFLADVPAWWVWIFYISLLIGLTLPIVWQHGRWALLTGAAWLVLGVVLQLWPHRPGEFRCTFLAVGHGGCTVMETSTGTVIVYDAGATAGPEVTRRSIAPFLWSRGIRRIDELILSHADLDHFNGVPQLADRFRIGKVISTPSFAERSAPAVQKTLESLERRGIAIEAVHIGQRWEADELSFEVLHPPALGPAGKENARSLVLLVKHGAWSMLLTGDLEDKGLTQVLAQKPPRVDLLMAPHHGSDTSNIPALAMWAKPKLVVSSQTVPRSERKSIKMYQEQGAAYLGTWPHGAITIRPGADVQVETYRTKLKLNPF